MKVVSAGYMPVDIVYPFNGNSFRSIGGTAANVGLILSFFGWKAVLGGQLGNDDLADDFIAEVVEAGASANLLRRADGAETPRLLHRVDADGHGYAYTCPRCHQRFPRSRPMTLDLAREVAEHEPSADVLVFDRVNAGTVWLAEHYAEAGSTVVFEPSLPTGGALFRRACEAAHVIKHSVEMDLPIPAALPDRRPEQVRVLTNGAAGLTYTIGGHAPVHLPAIPTLTVDTAGAGDWTTSALIFTAVGSSGLELSRVEDGLRLGQALAAVCCSVVGARSLMRLTPRTVMKHAVKALEANSVSAAPRIPESPPVAPGQGRCSVCDLAI